MTAAVLILFWVQNERSFNAYHKNTEDIYRITNRIKINPSETWIWETSPSLMGEAAKKEIPEILSSARLFLPGPLVLAGNNKLFTEDKTAYIDKDWFNFFDYRVLSGELNAKNANGLVLTERTASKYFGEIDPIGRVVTIERKNYTVQAVVENSRANSSFQFDVMIPLSSYLTDPSIRKNDGWGNFNFITFLKLSPKASSATVVKKLNAILIKNKGDNSITASLQPLKNIYFEEGLQSSELVHGDKKMTGIFSALAFLLLLIACINYVNLTTAHASRRSKEVSIRKIAGAPRSGLFGQFLIESFIVSTLALLITLLFVKLCLPVFNALADKELVFSLTSSSLWTVLVGTLLFATAVNGIYPAVLLSSFKPMHVFRGQAIQKVKDSAVRKALVVFQFSLSVMLIIATIIVYKQLDFVRKANPGYNASQVITFEIPYDQDKEKASFYTAFKHDLEQQSSISGVSIAGSPVVDLNNSSSGNIDWDGRDTAYNPSIVQYSADADFKRVLGLKVIEGSWFSGQNDDQQNYILNETAAKQFNMHKPIIGQRFTMDGVTGRISGVIKDFHYKSLHSKIGPMVIRSNAGSGHFVFVKTATGASQKALKAIDQMWKRHYPSQPLNYTFLDDTFNRTYRSDINISRIVLAFSLVAILISALGLFGLTTFALQQRTKEIGIRKVLGASISGIVELIAADFIPLVAIAIIIASPLAWYIMDHWLQDFAYRINIQWWMFIFSGAVAVVTALVSIGFQAIRAALANPVKSLRSE